MIANIFLIAPMTADSEKFPAILADAMDRTDVAALLLPRGERGVEDYAKLVSAVLPIAQPRGCAVLLDNEPEMAKALGADGVHMTTGIKAFEDAIKLLKPDMIVGAGNIHSRHDAMSKGEAGADYLFFGPVSGNADPVSGTEAAWWADTFEIPAVHSNPEMPDAAECEFVALSDSVWNSDKSPAEALANAAKALSAQ